MKLAIFTTKNRHIIHTSVTKEPHMKKSKVENTCPECGAKISKNRTYCNSCTEQIAGPPRRLPNIISAYMCAFKNCLQFKGRSIRLEYGLTFLATVIVAVCIIVVAAIISSSVIGYAILTYLAIMLLPYLALTVRRLHDVDAPIWTALIGLIPILGWIFFVRLITRPSANCDNKHGPNPYIGRKIPPNTDSAVADSVIDTVFDMIFGLFMQS